MRAVIIEWRGSYGFAKKFGGGEFFIHANDVECGQLRVGRMIECDKVPDRELGRKTRPEAKRIRVLP